MFEADLCRTRVYVAGPYNSDPEANTSNAILWGEQLLNAGYAPFVPHLSHYWHGVFEHSHEDWLRLDLPWVSVSDVLFRLPGMSPGAEAEVSMARRAGIPVFTFSYRTLTADVMRDFTNMHPARRRAPELHTGGVISAKPEPEPEPVKVPVAILSALDLIEKIFEKKNADYADERTSWRSNFEDVARQMGITDLDAADVLIAVKQARLRALRSNGRPPANEAASDTYLDRAVYAVIALAMLIEDDQYVT